MGELGLPELLIILAIVVLIFGPSRLIGVASGLGQAIRAFRHSTQEEVTTPQDGPPAG